MESFAFRRELGLRQTRGLAEKDEMRGAWKKGRWPVWQQRGSGRKMLRALEKRTGSTGWNAAGRLNKRRTGKSTLVLAT